MSASGRYRRTAHAATSEVTRNRSVPSCTQSRCGVTSVQNTKCRNSRSGACRSSRLTAEVAVANTETTSCGRCASISSRSAGTSRPRAAASASRAIRAPGRSAEKWKASYTPGRSSSRRNTASPAAPERCPSRAMASTVRVVQPRSRRVSAQAWAITSWPCPSEPETSRACGIGRPRQAPAAVPTVARYQSAYRRTPSVKLVLGDQPSSRLACDEEIRRPA